MQNEYIIINKTAIQKRIEELEERKKVVELNLDLLISVKTEISVLKQILSQSTPLIPKLEKVWDAAIGFNEAYYKFDEDLFSKEEWYQLQKSQKEVQKQVLNKQDYISNLKLDI